MAESGPNLPGEAQFEEFENEEVGAGAEQAEEGAARSAVPEVPHYVEVKVPRELFCILLLSDPRRTLANDLLLLPMVTLPLIRTLVSTTRCVRTALCADAQYYMLHVIVHMHIIYMQSNLPPQVPRSTSKTRPPIGIRSPAEWPSSR